MPIIEFDTKMRGYDPQQVNDAVTNFQDTINKYAQANTDLKRTLDTVNNQFTQQTKTSISCKPKTRSSPNGSKNSKSRTTIWKQKSRTSTRAWATM